MNYDDFTVNNEINQVLKYCVEKLYLTSKDAFNLRAIQLLRCLMAEVTLPKIITIQKIDNIKINRLNQRYEYLLEIAKLFLNQQSLLFSSGNIKIPAFFINMNQLFEKFITNFIERHHSEILFPRLQDYHIISQARGINKYLAHSDNNQSSFLLKPDLVVKSGEHFPLLLDTKYKILTPSDHISSSDFYQMYAYANRYNCPLVVVIYPQTGDTPARNENFQLQGSDKIIRVGTVDLRGDLHQSQEQKKLIKRLKELLQR